MLPRDCLVVGDENVARFESTCSIALHTIDNDRSEVGDKMRDAAYILRNERAVGGHERRAEIAHFVNHHVVRGAMEIGRHLVGDGGQSVADDFQRDGVKMLRHGSLLSEITSSPVGATERSSPGKSTVVEPYSLTRAGPVNFAPGG